MTDRKCNYKKGGISADTLRKSRLDNAVNLRKEKRDEVMSKRRNIQISPRDTGDDMDEEPVTASEFSALISAAKSDNLEEQGKAVTRIRKILNYMPVDTVVRSGSIPVLVECLSSNHPVVVFEAAWALTNIAADESRYTELVVKAGAVPKFIEFLRSSDTDLCEQAVWGIGNIIGDGAALRDYCIDLGVLEPLVELVEKSNSISFVRNLAWVFVNLCRRRGPPPALHIVDTLLSVIRRLLEYSDLQVALDGVWALAYLTDYDDDVLTQMTIDSGLVDKVITTMIDGVDSRVQMASIRVAGNISIGSDEQTQHVLDTGVLTHLPKILSCRKSKVHKEVAWFISNVCAGTEAQLQAVFDAGIIPPLANLLETGEASVVKEVSWAIANITISGNAKQAVSLVDYGLIPILCSLLKIKNVEIVLLVLDSLQLILKKSNERQAEVCVKIEECGGLESIEHLENHENEQVYRLAYDIVADYFSQDDDEHENDIYGSMQVDTPSGGFSFS